MNDNRHRIIGTLVYVSAEKFIVELKKSIDNFTVIGFDDNHYIARLGSYLIIPTGSYYVIVEIIGIRDKELYSGSNNDLEISKIKNYSNKYLDTIPIGMLSRDYNDGFRFGISQYPALYSDVLYIKDKELDIIFEVESSEVLIDQDSDITRLTSLSLGQSVVFEGYDIKIKIDEFFGSHSAILGNTGSGKSCTISSILQSLFSKPNENYASGATFLLFDVNGEYKQALKKLNKNNIAIKEIKIDGSSENFCIPHWLFQLEEWELLLRASEKTQIPILRNALALASFFHKNEDSSVKLHILATCIIECFRGSDGDSPVAQIRKVESILAKFGNSELNDSMLDCYQCNRKFGNFPEGQQEFFLKKIKTFILDGFKFPDYTMAPFDFSDLEMCLEIAILFEESHGNRHIRDYCSSLLTRFKHLKTRDDYEFIRMNTKEGIDEQKLLCDVLGLESKPFIYKQNQIIIFDLNELDDEIVELVASIISRLIFQFLRKQNNRNIFPVNLILEEAHRYISNKPRKYAIDASLIFERIAKEGRKFGLFLMLASQRPSELSKTVLSQCSNYIIHRIQNPDDIMQIRSMTPFISSSLLSKIPSLPKQHALVFGNAINIPTTIKINTANPRNKSDDAKISQLWFTTAQEPLDLNIT